MYKQSLASQQPARSRHRQDSGMSHFYLGNLSLKINTVGCKEASTEVLFGKELNSVSLLLFESKVNGTHISDLLSEEKKKGALSYYYKLLQHCEDHQIPCRALLCELNLSKNEAVFTNHQLGTTVFKYRELDTTHIVAAESILLGSSSYSAPAESVLKLQLNSSAYFYCDKTNQRLLSITRIR